MLLFSIYLAPPSTQQGALAHNVRPPTQCGTANTWPGKASVFIIELPHEATMPVINNTSLHIKMALVQMSEEDSLHRGRERKKKASKEAFDVNA
jgi:hypothetical protein